MKQLKIAANKGDKPMVINNLFIKLKKRDKDSISEAVKMLERLKGNIPELVESVVKTDIRAGESAFDIMLINTFNSAEDMPLYLKHPVHVEVGSYIAEAKEQSVSLCYEV